MVKHIQHLTAREHEILDLISRGWSNPGIAKRLSISINTVKYHLKKIFGKLEAKNRIEALNKMHEMEQQTL